MDSYNEEAYQIATLVVVVLTVLVCMCYLLIFVNPQVVLNPFKPSTAVPTEVAFSLQPTWTPTPTPTSTLTPTPTSTPTITPSPTPTLTPSPTRTLVPTRRLPTRTRTPTVSPWKYRPVLQSCTHSGGTFIKGTVWNNGQPQTGVRIRVSWGPGDGAATDDQITGYQADGSNTYTFVLKESGSFGSTPANWYVWVVDSGGIALSDPNAGHIQTNNLPDGPGSCWLAVLDFVN